MEPINGPDLILEVIRARPNEASNRATPSSDVRASVVNQGPDAQEVAFVQVVQKVAASSAAEADVRSADPTAPPLAGMMPRRASEQAQTPEAMLQGLLLKSVVEVMLPKEGGSFFGDGTAGSVWRSMLAQHVADQLNQKLDLQLVLQASERRPEPIGEQDSSRSQGIADVKPRVRES